MFIAIAALGSLALIFGLVLGIANIRFHVEGDPIADKVDKLLPQSQCGQCGFAGCRPYAEAVAQDESDINLCPPGGETTMIALAELLGRDPVAVTDVAVDQSRKIARIQEGACIGCTKCLRSCPVDAIIGAAKHMHTVVTDECTGCGKCLEPCPMVCIELEPVDTGIRDWQWPHPQEIAA